MFTHPLSSAILSQPMKLLHHGGHKGRHRFVHHVLQMLNGRLVVQAHLQVFLDLLDGLVRLQRNVRNRGVHHQREQIQHHLGLTPQMQVRRVAELPECEKRVRRQATHGVDHFLAELHGRRHGLRITAQDIAEVDVEQVARGGQEEIVQVAITDACQTVGNCCVKNTNIDILQILFCILFKYLFCVKQDL